MTERAIREETEQEMRASDQPVLIRVFAHILSILFHPLFIPVYVTCFLLFVHPALFTGYTFPAKAKLAGTVTVNLCFLPAFTVFLCWRLGFTRSFFLQTQKERIIPLAAAMIFYFWCWFVLRNFTEIPVLFRQFLLGSFITIIVAWLANIYYKISLHALALGGMACFLLLVAGSAEGFSGSYLAAGILVAGAVSSARLMISDHRPVEIYSGLFMGACCQLLAMWFN